MGFPAKMVHILYVSENAQVLLEPLKRSSRGVDCTLKKKRARRAKLLPRDRCQKTCNPADFTPGIEQEKGPGPMIDDSRARRLRPEAQGGCLLVSQHCKDRYFPAL